MTVHDTVHGFIVEREVPLPELDAVMYQMKHEKTGLELVWISREEENKVFGIGFETLPWNDTGVFHILEHSVLCGSKNYPVKEPFVELLKNSMNTFLNAMTFPDKTFYPVASRNDKDFVNLMRVYLDAVFYPAVYTKPEIFYQEGWHYELDSEGKPSYKGVVFTLSCSSTDFENDSDFRPSRARCCLRFRLCRSIRCVYRLLITCSFPFRRDSYSGQPSVIHITTSKGDSRLIRRPSVAIVRSPNTCATTVFRSLSYA